MNAWRGRGTLSTSEEATLTDLHASAAPSPEQAALEVAVEVTAAEIVEEAPVISAEQIRGETLAAIDFASIEPILPEEWERMPLPDWLEKSGERIYVNSSTQARLFRYITTWEDRTWQEMWSLYVTPRKSPDAICIRMDLALAMHDRHRSTGFSAKGTLVPWRT